MADSPYPRLVQPSDGAGSSSGQPPAGDGEDPREVFRLRILEDMEEEKALLYRFCAVGELVVLSILIRQIVIVYWGG